MRGTFKIYAIQHNQTKKIYIGSTHTSIEDRYKWHISDLKEGKHSSKEMQSEFNKYGDDYSVFCLESGTDHLIKNPYHEKRQISTRSLSEYKWMEKYDSINPDYGYNSQDRAAKCFIRRKKIFDDISMNFKDGIPEREEQ